MGVPALFRWLSRKYPKIILPVVEAPATDAEGNAVAVDCTLPNPNGEEFDNLYLDMNGIVHPCSHPEDRPPPRNEQEMMTEVFRYTDRIMAMVRPRKLLMIAVDGVAPRAKMNQQRSRRFRSAQEAEEKQRAKEAAIEEIVAAGGQPPEEGPRPWDSNVITPGTPFMDILASSLRYWVRYKFNTDPAWEDLKVLISDASVPGEGEHKIMEFVRSQRSDPRHDPNTRHVIYGLDADLIMLSLATHEPYFRVLREDVFFQQNNGGCHNCGQKGHIAAQCTAPPPERSDDAVPVKKPFIWLDSTTLREYLEVELRVPGQRTAYDFERAIDDWVFIIFFVGNDFLPHLPSLDIREGAIDVLVDLWKRNLDVCGGYITCDGKMDVKRVHYMLDGIAQQEGQIFKRRKQQEDRNAQRDRDRERSRQHHAKKARLSVPDSGDLLAGVSNSRSEGADDNAAAAAKLRADLLKKDEPQQPGNQTPEPTAADQPATKKRAFGEFEDDVRPSTTATSSAPDTSEEEQTPDDNVRLYEDGFMERYYEQKFHAEPGDVDFRRGVARDYVEGLAWVLLYYYQGCPSWTWFYPHHYAPFAADFDRVADVVIAFDKGQPARPYEQLLGVMPTASRHVLPEPLQHLMTDEAYGILDFYPLDFPVDLNGKKFAWQGVVLLPFIDQARLLEACAKGYALLSDAEMERNQRGHDALYFSERSEKMYDLVVSRLYRKKAGEGAQKLDMRLSGGLSGSITKDPAFVPNCALPFPFETGGEGYREIASDCSVFVEYGFPQLKHAHKSMLLRGLVPPKKVLDRRDLEQTRHGGGDPRRSRHDNDRCGNNNRARDVLDPAQHRQAPQQQQHGASGGAAAGSFGALGGGAPVLPPWLAGSLPPPPGVSAGSTGWQGHAPAGTHARFDASGTAAQVGPAQGAQMHNGGMHIGGRPQGRHSYRSHAQPQANGQQQSNGQHRQNGPPPANRYARGGYHAHTNANRPALDAWRTSR